MSIIYKEYPNFLTVEQSNDIIKNFTDPNRKAEGKNILTRATVDDNINGGSKEDPGRKAELLFFKKNGIIAKKYGLDKIYKILNSGDFGNYCIYNIKNFEDWQFIKYDVGGEYLPHYDYDADFRNSHNKLRVISGGGLRLKSIILYLNDDFEGGETAFPKIDLKIKPETGKLFVWDNVGMDRKLNLDTFHASLPIIKGTKYVLITWLREMSR